MKILIVAVLVSFASAKSYVGDKVFRLYPDEEKHFQLLEYLEAQRDMVDFWKPEVIKGLRTHVPVDVHIPRENLQLVTEMINDAGIKSQIMIENMQELVDNQYNSLAQETRDDAFNYNKYHTYDQIMQWVSNMAAGYPEVVHAERLTTSFLGAEVPYLLLGSQSGLSTELKILISCGENAREWISPAVCQCIVRDLATGYGNEERPTEMLDRASFIVVPVLNVDGYNYTLIDRSWSKTRSEYDNNDCIGVNTNTNFDVNYGGPGTSDESCTNIYRGPRTESEPEVEALANLMRGWGPQSFISFQSYGQQILYPFFYDRKSPPNQITLKDTARKMEERILVGSQHAYINLAGHDDGVLKSGRSADYVTTIGSDYTAFQIQLPDTGEYGYLLPESEIELACVDAMNAVEVAFEELLPPV